ncbi:Lipoprotein releasing system ATP-binding protein LolD [uncultured Gammaproteobacteria bacterium]|jgi:lipoprotein-releasing system ATP-binding protein|uniref:ABC transporter ATP-binding protein n=1 Tax=thiotrophic endosymbiont of Bathymodiolus puteoserpentis (Logatchev) TaxID=343240 RepID=UPI0010B86081|nr:ATP-binding cassette domain-containing protein [thiotrophic endosymbiont of Bathymodiolus puteoserpentis (Logatchev)]CAC9494015.1 Lipoprotein-releasing system ATP-binding protein LolD [uncultured Gammaproteobacteria bacterium]CAC9584839.1 Lipoprotein-releasing system ATP-binding protein LolD [uncultured Gammaproteobacteria bacterium]CAC9599068.1 Lipoprotein-releasing system ATP-binding protein LolD [uncultured Gammaproteobacteria bacterium]CAC9603233.1 Lipoprotein-releasing system ATP-bindin
MNKIIECQNLGYAYNDGEIKTPVLNALNLEINPAESLAIIGQSGCGKSTLLNLLGGMDQPTTGKVMINNADLSQLSEEAITNLRAQHLGFIYQFHHLLKDFSALDNVAMPLLIRGDATHLALEKSSKLLSDIGLQNRLNHRPAELSGGQRQRVAIARALINNPSCLLADEPTGNLDAKNAQEVLGLMMELNQQQKSALILVTHDMNIAKKMDQFLTLENGTLV